MNCLKHLLLFLLLSSHSSLAVQPSTVEDGNPPDVPENPPATDLANDPLSDLSPLGKLCLQLSYLATVKENRWKVPDLGNDVLSKHLASRPSPFKKLSFEHNDGNPPKVPGTSLADLGDDILRSHIASRLSPTEKFCLQATLKHVDLGITSEDAVEIAATTKQLDSLLFDPNWPPRTTPDTRKPGRLGRNSEGPYLEQLKTYLRKLADRSIVEIAVEEAKMELEKESKPLYLAGKRLTELLQTYLKKDVAKPDLARIGFAVREAWEEIDAFRRALMRGNILAVEHILRFKCYFVKWVSDPHSLLQYKEELIDVILKFVSEKEFEDTFYWIVDAFYFDKFPHDGRRSNILSSVLKDKRAVATLMESTLSKVQGGARGRDYLCEILNQALDKSPWTYRVRREYRQPGQSCETHIKVVFPLRGSTTFPPAVGHQLFQLIQ